MENCQRLALIGCGFVQDLDLTGEIPALRIEVTSFAPGQDITLKDGSLLNVKRRRN